MQWCCLEDEKEQLSNGTSLYSIDEWDSTGFRIEVRVWSFAALFVANGIDIGGTLEF